MICIRRLDPDAAVPLYRQLYESIRDSIYSGAITDGERLPATRELAVQIGLNRTTVSAAYALLEGDRLIEGHVGRGSFVRYSGPRPARESRSALISFESSRPAESEFPLAELQATAREVLASAEFTSVLQLGSPSGYQPLRKFLLEQAREEGAATADDDIIITSGCQQALDLIQRVFAPSGSTALVEDPVYHGVRNVFTRADVRLAGVPVGEWGIDPALANRMAADERPSLLMVTPNFQNPTGSTVPLDARERVLQANVPVIAENDIYGGLRYHGSPIPSLKQLDHSGRVLLIRSFSKVAFPGLRVGWIIGARRHIARLTEAKQWCDLHTDQLSQAVLLRFAASGRLAEHIARVQASGRERLGVLLRACDQHLPDGSRWTRPEGGMNLWVRLPHPYDAEDLAPYAERAGVTYLSGRNFAVTKAEMSALRLSFGSLAPQEIETGMERLGRVLREAAQTARESHDAAVPAIV